MATPSSASSSSSGGVQPPMYPLKKAGILYKKTGLARSWKPRFFSLEGTVLYYYKREGDSVPKGIVVLTGCNVKTTRDKKYYSFRISHPKTSKVYDLAATLPSRTEDWMELLQEASRRGLTSSLSTRESIMERPTMDFSSSSSGHSFGLTGVATDVSHIHVEGVCMPDEFADRLERLMAEFVKQAQDDAEGWKLQSEQRDVKAYVRSASKLGSFKGVGFINYHPHVVLKLILDISRRNTIDPQLLSSQRLVAYDDHTFVDHLVYKAVFPASARDFLNITHWRVLNDGSIIVIATHMEKEDLCPPQEPQVVRGKIIMAGFLLTPNADYTGVHAAYITKADIKAGIPVALQTKMFIKQAFVIDELRKVLDNDDNAQQTDALERVTNQTYFDIHVTDRVIDEEEIESEQPTTDDEGGSSRGRGLMTAPSLQSVPEEGFPSVPEKYKDVIDKLLARMDTELNDDAWQFHSEKYGVKAYTKVDGSLTAAKGVGFLPYHPRAIFDMFTDPSKRKLVDPQLASGSRLARLDEQTSIGYLEFKPIFVVAGRDFCTLTHWRVLSDGTIIIVAQSIEDLTLCPLKEPKVVRAEVHISCTKIVPNAAYNGAEVTYMGKTDLKGSIPARIAGKAASEQPYLIQRIGDHLKKSKDLDEYTAQGKLTNTLFELPRNTRSISMQSSKSSSSNKSSRSVRTSTTLSSQPESEKEPTTTAVAAPKKSVGMIAATKSAHSTENKDVLDPPPQLRSTTDVLCVYAVQFFGAMFALKYIALPGVLHYGAAILLLLWFALQLHLGPCHMTPRRKLMIASFGPPDTGMILGTLELDVTKTLLYIAEKRISTGSHITITHIVLRALGAALAKAPSVNGHIVFGNYYPAPSVVVSCLVAADGGKDLGVCRLPDADKMTVQDICNRLRGDATKLRNGEDKAQQDRNNLLKLLPTWVIRPITNFVSWLGGACGIQVKALGVEPYMFGCCMVTSVGMMGLDLAFAPITPYAQTPMLVTIGSIQEKPVVVDGEIVIRPILTVTTTIDHRYVDGSQAARMAHTLKEYVQDPRTLEPVTL